MPDPHFDPARLDAAQSNRAPLQQTEHGRDLQQRKRHWAWAIGVAVLLALVIVGLNLWQRGSAPATPASTPAPAPTPTPVPTPEPVPTPAAEAVIEHPVAPVPPPTPLPALADSDTLAQQALAGLISSTLVKESFNTEQLIRRIVATVDNLPRAKMAQRQSPLKPVAGSFTVAPSGAVTTISADNARRYEPWVQVLSTLDMHQVAGLYRQFYPLFQNAYEELGYPKAYFNDRLIAVLDHLLATPPAPVAPVLAQPKVLYEYADPELEARSAGQKVLLRLSPAQALKVKMKLKELRAQIAVPPAAHK